VTPPEISTAVIGGGIGGLATALSPRRAGFDVHVQTREAREVGAGIQISSNTTRILHRLGVAEKLATMVALVEGQRPSWSSF
jgi:salicylate hydroxylase